MDGWVDNRPKGAAQGGVQNANAGCAGATLQRCNVATLQRRNSAPLQRCNVGTVHRCNAATSEQCTGASLHAWQGPVMGPVINDVQHAKIWAHIDGAPTPPPPPAPPVD
jgi:hypothetical protein